MEWKGWRIEAYMMAVVFRVRYGSNRTYDIFAITLALKYKVLLFL